ncbi:Major facilitator superfamily [Macrophomina phaseolina MS6]|uniref:Major facilitator superfamily n=2 Tax=Macrophomina phaseolina TaxID=35725 RepID=K2S658_MACPH|nr:Major facilitator superfamily [Macrophomina phaseolina MS6]
MDGILGHRGWRWILIIEGIPTMLLAIMAYFCLADSPELAKYLTPDEKILLRLRQRRSTGGSASAHVLQKKDVYAAFKDWKLWLLCVVGFNSASMFYGYSTFLPTIIHGIDPSYSVAMVQVMTIPCYLGGAAVMVAAAYLSDRLQKRASIAATTMLLSCAGYGTLLATTDSGAGYAGCFLIALGMYPAMMLSLSLVIANTPRYGKRSMGIAMSTMSVNTGGIMMSYIYPKTEGPRYKRGHSVTLSLVAVAIVCLAFLSGYLSHKNRRRRAGLEDYKIADMTEEEIEELGDRSPRFIYTT